MHSMRTFGYLGLVSLGLALASGEAISQDGKTPAAAEPTGAAWPATVSKDPGTGGRVLSDDQIAAVRKVSTYFNELNTLKGLFVQTDPDSKKAKGKFYVKRPGQFRFDYGAPTKKVMVSDGRFLAIEEPDTKNPDTFELDSSPFRLLFRKDVDLIRDARIIDVQEAEDLIVVSLQDKSPDAPGKIQLFLATKPEVALKEWVITDAQGLETRVEISDLDRTGEIDSNLFRRANPALKKM
jgi:outer membrane lipoprotein-sorting protein